MFKSTRRTSGELGTMHTAAPAVMARLHLPSCCPCSMASWRPARRACCFATSRRQQQQRRRQQPQVTSTAALQRPAAQLLAALSMQSAACHSCARSASRLHCWPSCRRLAAAAAGNWGHPLGLQQAAHKDTPLHGCGPQRLHTALHLRCQSLLATQLQQHRVAQQPLKSAIKPTLWQGAGHSQQAAGVLRCSR